MTGDTEQPMETAPDDGTEFQIRVGRRWFRAAYRVDWETGEVRLYAMFGGPEWWPAKGEAWKHFKCAASRRGASDAHARLAPRASAPSQPSASAEPVLVATGGEAPIAFAELHTRVTRMVLTLRAMRDPEWRFLSAGHRINWPATVDSLDDILAQRENQTNLDPAPERWKPSPRDLTLLDETFAWFRVLDPLTEPVRREILRHGRREPLSDTQRLIWWQALGASHRTIGKRLGVSDETARRRTNAAWERLWRIACDAIRPGSAAAPGAQWSGGDAGRPDRVEA